MGLYLGKIPISSLIFFLPYFCTSQMFRIIKIVFIYTSIKHVEKISNKGSVDLQK